MASGTLDILGLTGNYDPAEAGWDATMNANLLLIDLVAQIKVISRTNTPPGSPANGNVYLCADAPTGAWAGQAGKLAVYRSGGWVFVAPKQGWLIYDATAECVYVGGTSGAISVNHALRPINAPVAFPVVVDPVDNTKWLLMDVSAIGAGVSRTVTWRNMAITPMHVGGDAMTGTLNMGDNVIQRGKFLDSAQSVKAISTVTGLGAFDLQLGNVQSLILDGNVTLQSFTGWPATGNYGECIVILTQGGLGTYTVSWAAAVLWPGAAAPVITATLGKTDVLKFWSVDGGTTVYGEVLGQNY